MAVKVLVGETYGGPAELQADLNAAIAGITPASPSDIVVSLTGGLHATRWVISYRT